MRTLLLCLLIASTGCTDSGQPVEQAATCESMCTHLLSNILDGCMKTDDQLECVTECNEHFMDGEFDQNGLDCGATAGTCEAWRLCGDLL